jgi:transcriptional regulator with XRE-family HTH domain
MTFADLARQVELSRTAIMNWRHGSLPRRETINWINEWSHGEILPADWLTPAPSAGNIPDSEVFRAAAN